MVHLTLKKSEGSHVSQHHKRRYLSWDCPSQSVVVEDPVNKKDNPLERLRKRRARPTLHKAYNQHSIKCSILGHTAHAAWSTSKFAACPSRRSRWGACEKKNSKAEKRRTWPTLNQKFDQHSIILIKLGAYKSSRLVNVDILDGIVPVKALL